MALLELPDSCQLPRFKVPMNGVNIGGRWNIDGENQPLFVRTARRLERAPVALEALSWRICEPQTVG
jgi:hypothetical protein